MRSAPDEQLCMGLMTELQATRPIRLSITRKLSNLNNAPDACSACDMNASPSSLLLILERFPPKHEHRQREAVRKEETETEEESMVTNH